MIILAVVLAVVALSVAVGSLALVVRIAAPLAAWLARHR